MVGQNYGLDFDFFWNLVTNLKKIRDQNYKELKDKLIKNFIFNLEN